MSPLGEVEAASTPCATTQLRSTNRALLAGEAAVVVAKMGLHSGCIQERASMRGASRAGTGVGLGMAVVVPTITSDPYARA